MVAVESSQPKREEGAEEALCSLLDSAKCEAMPRKKYPARRPAWMKSAELVEAMAHADSTVPSLAGLDQGALRRIARKRLLEEIDFIPNRLFYDSEMGKKLFDARLGLAPHRTAIGVAAIRKNGVDLPVHLARLCEAELLTPEQERMLFERMNFLLHLAATHRSFLDPLRPSQIRWS